LGFDVAAIATMTIRQKTRSANWPLASVALALIQLVVLLLMAGLATYPDWRGGAGNPLF